VEVTEGFAVGARIGRYELVELLGKGGMGAVYRAHDETLRRSVALKVVVGAAGPGGPPDAISRRILREARMAASFAHPNVVAIYDMGEHDGTPFIVMEVVEGRSMRAFVGGGAPAATRAAWLVDVARGLAAAHRRGLVHRDIKPENVMVSDEGTVKVLDFGIAGPTERAAAPVWPAGGATSGNTFATLERGVISGTPAYMAPEALREGAFDARTDQFAWGVMAYEVLSGAHPFWLESNGGLDVRLAAIAKCEALPLDADVIGVPQKLVTAFRRWTPYSRSWPTSRRRTWAPPVSWQWIPKPRRSWRFQIGLPRRTPLRPRSPSRRPTRAA
jgi:eukaryotic-like serine/threonine-protein kinase